MKECNICKETKALTEFYTRKLSKDGREGVCKVCRMKQKRSRKNFIEQTRRATIKHDLKRKGNRWEYHLTRTYGLSQEDYFNMLDKQDYCCPICLLPVDKEMHYGKFVVDHCHNSGKVRGLLCNKCNLLLGNARDNIKVLEQAITYLKERN